MRFFIGHDSRQEINTKACVHSLNHYGVDPSRIDLSKMRKLGYTRNEDGSTEFAYTRFLVPYLCQYEGYAVFCDSDFIWRKDPSALLSLIDPQDPVSCVQHPKMDVVSDTKFKGNKNEWYPKKWWSSMMVFNCSHYDVVENLSLENINSKSPAWLHRMEWASSIGNLPREYNHLVRYYEYNPESVAVHFTEGTPMYHEYSKDDYADEWKNYAGLK